MYMIFTSQLMRTHDGNKEYYHYLANFNNEEPEKNYFWGHIYIGASRCRSNNKTSKMWSEVNSQCDSVEQAFNKILSNSLRKNYFIFENLEDATNASAGFENNSIEVFQSIIPERRNDLYLQFIVKYYIISVNARQVNVFSINGEQRTKNIPFEFVEISRETSLNIENIPYVPADEIML